MAKDKPKQKAEDFKGKSADELNTMLLDLRKQQMNLRFQKASGSLENTSTMRAVRRTIARVKTFLTKHNNKKSA
jgi:large subunit ribosomal protein L29